ncbi:hypothetical protein KU75_20885 [Pectobacterium odoriferum]|uniref:Darcynin 1 n=1 Tax=Pectobacterium odoriferum TaxID=78398 RepID=A0ABR4VK67_9GAMM|nr:darcynin family protein [Pectobacterium odoriferum]KGA39754.1 hypothetical protein KU75_20885 [Pectobacterium odoriferum]POD98018.1 hypothetical protein BVY05_20605 [Pectobacterium odoriferum]
MKYIIVWTLTFNDKWNALTRAQRMELQNESLPEVIEKYQHSIRLRTADAEGFSADFQDIIIIETASLKDYYCMLQDMRNSKVLSESYLKITNIFIGVENAHEVYQSNTI